jgi:hypothetical protein
VPEVHQKAYKKDCTGAKEYNCFLIRATPIGPTKANPTDADYIEPFPLKSFGNWDKQMREIKDRLK